ncbi:MAG: gliding motility-associated ABC transporter ATP-binding subunit GldA [Flavobacteriales bacterium]
MSIKVENITKEYGDQKALDNVSFNIESSEVVGFLGPNGAGKTTMMKILTSFIPPTGGNASVCDLDVIENSIEVRKNVGYLPENNPLYYDMYVREYLEFIAGLHKLNSPEQKIEEIIKTVGLTPEQNKQVGTLSKGYKQRLGLAQALIHSPEVLILDEPTSGLDPNQLTEIRDLIKEIGKERTVMLSTHIMQEVEAVCDRAIIIDAGNIVTDSNIKDIREETSSEAKLTVEFDKEIKEKDLFAIDGVKEVSNNEGNTWKLKVNTSDDIRSRIFSFAVENELSVLTMQKEEKSLEDIFKQLTTHSESTD